MGEENMDYKTLVVFLREHAKHDGDCNICPCYDAENRGYGTCSEELAAKAADAVEDLISALTVSNEVIAKSKPKWIPVTEKLPEADPDTKYLVVCKTKSGRQSINMAWFDGQFWHGMGSMAGVTHWMPLPDPPEEG